MNYREPYQAADGSWLFVFEGQKYGGYATKADAWAALNAMIVAEKQRQADEELGQLLRRTIRQFQEALDAAGKIRPRWSARQMTERVQQAIANGQGDQALGATGFTANQLAALQSVFRQFEAFAMTPVDIGGGNMVEPVGILYSLPSEEGTP